MVGRSWNWRGERSGPESAAGVREPDRTHHGLDSAWVRAVDAVFREPGLDTDLLDDLARAHHLVVNRYKTFVPGKWST